MGAPEGVDGIIGQRVGRDPVDGTSRQHFLIACADDTLLLPESNDSNNCRASATTMAVIQ